jgi:hypothetical protein
MKFSDPWTALKVDESYPLRNMHIAAITQQYQRYIWVRVGAFMADGVNAILRVLRATMSKDDSWSGGLAFWLPKTGLIILDLRAHVE